MVPDAVIKELSIVNFRNIDHERLQLDGHVNALIGLNGQGKTNCLEAVYYLALLRSFRTSQIADLRQWKKDCFHLECVCSRDNLPDLRLGVSYGQDRRLSMNGNPVYRSSDYVNPFICVTFIPQDKELVRGSETLRRRFLDISISQLSPLYLRSLQSYLEALKSRNAMLKERQRYSRAMVTAYDQVLVRKGIEVEMARRSFVEKLNGALIEKSKVLLDETKSLSVNYLSGIGSLLQTSEGDSSALEQQYFDSLERHYERDCRDGYTHCGPHRSEMTCLMNRTLLSRYGSEGECRMASLALKFACLEILKESKGTESISLLVDDVVGELDAGREDNFYQELMKSGQLIMAATSLPHCMEGKGTVFSVVGGRFLH